MGIGSVLNAKYKYNNISGKTLENHEEFEDKKKKKIVSPSIGRVILYVTAV